ncbi:MAG: hypothetical protein ACRDGV_11060 [Candidatus Limnocylindria bacterium]
MSQEPGTNDPLTPQEVAWVRHQVGVAKEYVARLGLPEARLDEVHAKLDYLVEASERMGRFDWRQLAARIAVPSTPSRRARCFSCSPDRSSGSSAAESGAHVARALSLLGAPPTLSAWHGKGPDPSGLSLSPALAKQRLGQDQQNGR